MKNFEQYPGFVDGDVFVKVPNTPNNRILDADRQYGRHAFSGEVFPDKEVPEPYERRLATAFEVLTQTRAYSGFGANMGRRSYGVPKPGARILDRVVPICAQGYDQGGAYWGTGARLRVRYTADLSFAQFYREEFEFNVYGVYEHGAKVVTTEENYYDCRERLKEYRENEPGTRFYYRRERVIPEVPFWHSI